jgi:hypothetical protein
MAVTLITKNIWATLTKAAKLSKTKSMVAVAYFGQQGASMLPLKKGSTLLVDASEKAVKSGQTCPDELLKLYYKGVQIYSLENLHAKLFVIGKELFIGSTNVSGNSSKLLQEAIVKTNDKQAIQDAKAFIESHTGTLEMGEEQLMRLQKLYRPPKFAGLKAQVKKRKSAKTNHPSFLVYKLEKNIFTEKEREEAVEGRKEAKNHRINKSRHVLDEFIWGDNLVAKKGDVIMQIIDEGDKVYVAPPGTLIHVRKWNNGKKITNFCYVEIPDKNRKNISYLKKHFNRKTFKLINRNGRKSKAVAEELISLWK